MLNIGGPELLIILLVALVFLGPQRLPEVARQLGQAVGTLRSLASGFQAELEAASKPVTDAMKPVSGSMKLDGPIDQDEAIAQTQIDKTPTEETPANETRTEETPTDPFADSAKDPFAHTKTDAASVREAASKVTYEDEDGGAVSAGGPTDLRDEAE